MENNMNMHDHSAMEHNHSEGTLKDYLLFAGVIVGVIAIALGLTYWAGNFGWRMFARFFMATFFLVFGLFKIADLKGFVMSYIGYDIVAKKYMGYAYVYPFLELLLALGYFFGFAITDYFTVLLMTIGSIGVLKELLRGSHIKCACLGTYIKLPLTTVSLIEDLVMGVMALAFIVF